MLRLWSRGETYRFDSFGPSIRRHTDTDRTHLYSHKIRHFDKDWICIRLHLENKKKSIYRFEFLWFINFLYAIIHVKFSSFCNVKITCGDFFFVWACAYQIHSSGPPSHWDIYTCRTRWCWGKYRFADTENWHIRRHLRKNRIFWQMNFFYVSKIQEYGYIL